jgi:hypothetical protein
MVKNIPIVVILLLVFGCNKTVPVSVPKGQFSAIFLGVSNFGKVLIGKNRSTIIRLTNNTDSSRSVPNLTPSCETSDRTQCQFNLFSNGCPSLLAAGATCTATIKFAPLVIGNYQQFIDRDGFNLQMQGQGIEIGSLSIVDKSDWNIGIITAGNSVSREFVLSNNGQSDILAPSIVNVNNFFITETTCETYIRPGKNCSMVVLFNRKTAVASDENLQFLSSASDVAMINVHSDVRPASPNGAMSFSYLPTASIMKADGIETKTITIEKIPDMYGNQIIIPQTVNLTITNASFLGSTDPRNLILQTNISGKASFIIKSDLQTGVKTPITINLSNGNSFGLISIRPLSGTPARIDLMPFLDTLSLNSVSSVTIQTKPILDVNGGVVEDGTVIRFKHVSGITGSLDLGVTSTFQGIAHAKLSAPNTVGSEVIEVTSDTGDITTGPQTIHYVPGLPSGNFPVTPIYKVIYYQKDLSGIKRDSTNVVVGPILDSNLQGVGEGYVVDVTIYNGWLKGSQGQSVFEVFTGTDSIANFEVESNGYIGEISIEATVRSTIVTAKVHASSDQRIKFSRDPLNTMSFYKTYGSMIFDPSKLSPNSSSWNRLFKPDGITDADSSILGQTTYSSNIPTVVSFNFPKILGLDCFQNINEYTALFPCFYNKKFNSIQSPPSGSSVWGNSGFYLFGKDGSNSILESGSLAYDSQLGSVDNHGTYSTIFPIQSYLNESDRFYTFGGLQFANNSNTNSLIYNTTTSIYSGSNKVNSYYDKLNYSKSSLIGHRGIFLATTTESELNGKFIYGGFQTPKEATPYNLDSTISRIFNNPVTSEDSYEDLVILPDTLGNIPEPKILPGFYYDNNTDDVYLIGGLRKSGINYIFDDTIWKFNFKASSKKWINVCYSCHLPVMTNNYATILNFPIWETASIPSNFEDLQLVVHKTYVYKSDDGNVYMIYEGSSTNGGYILDLKNLVFSSASSSINNFSSKTMLRYNPYSGRLYGFDRNSDTSDNSLVSFYETPSETKQYYLSKFNLGTSGKENVLSLKFNINAYGKDALSSDYAANFYLYNFDTSRYDLIGQSNLQTDDQTKTQTVSGEITPSNNPSRYVDTNGNTYLLLTSGGNATLSGNGSGQSTLRINNITLDGIW